MARINVTVPDELKEWLDDNPQLTPSGLLQKAIEDEQRGRKQSDVVDFKDVSVHSITDDSYDEPAYSGPIRIFDSGHVELVDHDTVIREEMVPVIEINER